MCGVARGIPELEQDHYRTALFDGRSEHFGLLVTWVIVRRIVAGVIVVLLTSWAPPAEAQVSSPPTWTPKEARVLESDGEVVLTLSQDPGGSGRLRYSTADGTCVPPPRAGDAFEGFREHPPCEPEARAPADYTAVDGVFDGPGSKTIRIPIVDDDLSEGTEAFTVYAWGEPNGYNTDPYGGPSVIVRIDDDDTDDSGKPAASAATPTTAAAGSQSSSSAPVLTVQPAPSPDGDLPVLDLAAEVPSAELRPGPGFELTSEGSPVPAPGRGGEGGGSASWLVLGLGTAAAGIGALTFVRRRRRWSPTQA